MNVIQTLTTGHILPLCVFTLSSILRHFLHLIGPPPTLPQESICQMEWWWLEVVVAVSQGHMVSWTVCLLLYLERLVSLRPSISPDAIWLFSNAGYR